MARFSGITAPVVENNAYGWAFQPTGVAGHVGPPSLDVGLAVAGGVDLMRLFRTRSFRRRSFVALLSAVILGTGLAVPLAVSTAVTAAAITPRAESDQ